MPDQLDDEWTWKTWAFSSTIAETLVYFWARDRGFLGVAWIGSKRKGWDVQWEGARVDVKDASLRTAGTPDGERVKCVGFQGSNKREIECRADVTHYALVVRDVNDGPDVVELTRSGEISVRSQSGFAIYLVPNPQVNEFFHSYTVDGAEGKGRDLCQQVSALEQWKVFDNRQP